MTQDKVNSLMIIFIGCIPKHKAFIFKDLLLNAKDNAIKKMLKVKIYSPFVVLVFSIFFGGFGIDRFYIGDTKLGILKIFFSWFTLGIWTLVDIILCYLKAKEKNFNNFCAILSESNILA